MDDTGYLLWIYFIYLAASVGLTIWLAQMLFRNGALFLADVFKDNEPLAAAVNRLLVVGFYLLNLGWAFLIVRTGAPETGAEAAEVLFTKMGQLLGSLGLIHFANLGVFHLIRGRSTPPRRPAVAPYVAYHVPQPGVYAPPPPPV